VPDHAVSANPKVQRQLERLASLSPPGDVLGLERIEALLGRLGRPERAMPPVFHVAGTNGKGSTCAFLRAAFEAAGMQVHVYSSPHLVRFNERIRLGGKLIDDIHLADLLEEVLDQAGEIEASFFEVTTAAAFLAFSRNPAAACIVEVGLGGRLDATNAIERPAICAIAQLGLDHQSFLGSTLEAIALEKAGIAKTGVPLVTQRYPARISRRISEAAAAADADWLPRGDAWEAASYEKKIHYRDRYGPLELPQPRLQGSHQASNAALAVAMLRHQRQVHVPDSALRAAMGWVEWPARLQRLAPGPLHSLLPEGSELWLDGGHNPSAARAVADHFRATLPADRPFHIIFGLLENKDAAGVMKAFRNRQVTVHGVPVPGHAHHPPAALAAAAREAGLYGLSSASVEDALGWIERHGEHGNAPTVLVFGSLYLAGEVLRKNDQPPL
jgi:dihydrofolate synthase / folylpolyglutamate synthase